MKLTPTRRLGLALAAPTALALALTGCSASDPAGSGASSGTPSASAVASADTTTAPPASPGTTPADNLAFGPFGYGPLRLGMTIEEAKATGLVVNIKVQEIFEHCSMGRLVGPDKKVIARDHTGIAFSHSKLVAIGIGPGMTTPEGIKIGSTYKELHAAYPTWKGRTGSPASGFHSGPEGFGLVGTSGNPQADYFFEVEDGIVKEISLETIDGDCQGESRTSL